MLYGQPPAQSEDRSHLTAVRYQGPHPPLIFSESSRGRDAAGEIHGAPDSKDHRSPLQEQPPGCFPPRLKSYQRHRGSPAQEAQATPWPRPGTRPH